MACTSTVTVAETVSFCGTILKIDLKYETPMCLAVIAQGAGSRSTFTGREDTHKHLRE